MILAEVAHSRAGDKGTLINISVIVFDLNDYAWVASFLTADRMGAHLASVVAGEVARYELPKIGAFNFVFSRKPGHSVTRTLDVDAHGKALSSIVLSMEIPERPRDSSRRP